MSADGRTLVIAATNAVIFLDTLGQQPARSWPKPAHAVALSNDGKWVALEFSADGQWLLAAREDGETVAWNIPVIRRELRKLGLDWDERQ